MPVDLHSVAELRSRFQYDPDTGVISWKPVDFMHWSRGRPQSKVGWYERWCRTYAGRPVQFTTPAKGVGKVCFRGRTYSAFRLAWALHHGEHPGDTHRVVPANGDRGDVRAQNLRRISDAQYNREHHAVMREGRWPRAAGR